MDKQSQPRVKIVPEQNILHSASRNHKVKHTQSVKLGATHLHRRLSNDANSKWNDTKKLPKKRTCNDTLWIHQFTMLSVGSVLPQDEVAVNLNVSTIVGTRMVLCQSSMRKYWREVNRTGLRRAEQLISTTGNCDGVGHGEPAQHGLDHLWKQMSICRGCS